MDRVSFFKNFNMRAEIDIAGKFIYDGIKEFNRLESFYNECDIFYVLYHISVGIERLQKVLLVLLEDITIENYEEFEESLKTHSHMELQKRITELSGMEFNSNQNAFIQLLGQFYLNCRYNRFDLQGDIQKERDLLTKHLSEILDIEIIVDELIFPTPNDDKIKNYFGRVVGSIARKYYETIKEQANKLNIYTYELEYEPSAAKIFLPEFERESLQEQYFNEQISVKEFLIFLMNTKETSGFLNFIKSIEPISFDIALANDYLADICKGNIPHALVDEVESIYEDIENRKERLEYVEIVGKRNLSFDDDDEEEEGCDECDNED